MDFKINLEKKEDNSFVLETTVSAKSVDEKYKEVVNKEAKKADLKGFRKGKAPVKLVEEKIGKENLINLVLEEIIKEIYPQAIKEHDLNPIIPPKVKLINIKKGEDWQINFISSELPSIKVDDLKEKIKEANAENKIWTPDKEDKSENKKEQENKDKQIQKIIEIILESVEVNLPEVLIEQELNRKMVNLIDQVNQAGMKLEDYLSTKGTSVEEIKKQFRQEIANNWKIDLTLEELAESENIQVSEEDVQKIEKSKMNPYLAAKILRRQKTLEHLIAL